MKTLLPLIAGGFALLVATPALKAQPDGPAHSDKDRSYANQPQDDRQRVEENKRAETERNDRDRNVRPDRVVADPRGEGPHVQFQVRTQDADHDRDARAPEDHRDER